MKLFICDNCFFIGFHLLFKLGLITSLDHLHCPRNSIFIAFLSLILYMSQYIGTRILSQCNAQKLICHTLHSKSGTVKFFSHSSSGSSDLVKNSPTSRCWSMQSYHISIWLLCSILLLTFYIVFYGDFSSYLSKYFQYLLPCMLYTVKRTWVHFSDHISSKTTYFLD